MQNAISILKRSIDNLKSEALLKSEKLKEITGNRLRIEAEIEILVSRVEELEEAIKQLEGKQSETTSKNKKVKR